MVRTFGIFSMKEIVNTQEGYVEEQDTLNISIDFSFWNSLNGCTFTNLVL